MSADEILDQYHGVKEFCGGGITVTGGEPWVQIDFVTDLFKKLELKVFTPLLILPAYYLIKIIQLRLMNF